VQLPSPNFAPPPEMTRSFGKGGASTFYGNFPFRFFHRFAVRQRRVNRSHHQFVSVADLRIGYEVLKIPRWIAAATAGRRLRKPNLVLASKKLHVSHSAARAEIPRFCVSIF